MAEITFLELHLHDASFTTNAPFSADTAEEAESRVRRLLPSRGGDEDESPTVQVEGEGGGPGPLPLVLGLAFALLVGVAIRRVLAGEPEPVPA